jgi:type IV pilus assembly protein PilE
MRERGFTLMELMITVAIVAILAAIALPSFFGQLSKSRRADGQQALVTVAQNMEKYFTENSRYSDTAGSGTCPNPPSPRPPVIVTPSPEGYYAITAVCTDNTFTLTATAQGAQAGDTHCATLTYNELQRKDGTNTDCWQK